MSKTYRQGEKNPFRQGRKIKVLQSEEMESFLFGQNARLATDPVTLRDRPFARYFKKVGGVR